MINRSTIKVVAASLLILSISMLSSCRHEAKSHENTIYVSIAPIKYIVEAIVGSDFQIEVMVPAGGSPETFEPTPKQYIALNEAKAVMGTGLIDFERNLLSRINNKSKVVNLSEGVEIMEGSCSHNHGHQQECCEHEHEHHHHGVDPHIWTSPKQLQHMALNCYNAIEAIYPDSTQYKQNYQALQQSLEELDSQVAGSILASGVKSFVINHPAYTYFARDYGVEQIAIEDDGKDPSTRRIGEIIERAREEGVTQILYQTQFPSSVVDVIAKDAGAESVSIDPLSEDIATHITEFTKIITSRR